MHQAGITLIIVQSCTCFYVSFQRHHKQPSTSKQLPAVKPSITKPHISSSTQHCLDPLGGERGYLQQPLGCLGGWFPGCLWARRLHCGRYCCGQGFDSFCLWGAWRSFSRRPLAATCPLVAAAFASPDWFQGSFIFKALPLVQRGRRHEVRICCHLERKTDA